MMIRPAVDSGYLELYAGTLFPDADIRVKIRTSEGGLDGPAGIVFWASVGEAIVSGR